MNNLELVRKLEEIAPEIDHDWDYFDPAEFGLDFKFSVIEHHSDVDSHKWYTFHDMIFQIDPITGERFYVQYRYATRYEEGHVDMYDTYAQVTPKHIVTTITRWELV